jgi:hypothetical protein
MATDSIEYKIIIIDSDQVHYMNNNTQIYDFYVDMVEPLRDVYKIKVLYSALSIKTTTLTSSTYTNLDSVYIHLNDYSRIKTSLITAGKPDTDLSYFDSITIDLNKIKNNTGTDHTTMFNDFNVNEADYILNPIASQFNKINIQLKNKNNQILDRNYADRFFMKLCIYYRTKKNSRI